MVGSRKTLIQGMLWAASAITIWSGSLVLLRLGVTTNLNAYDLAALRFGAAGTLLLPFTLKHGSALSRIGAGELALMICGFGAPYIVLISIALQTAPASAAGALNPGMMAVSSVLLGALFLKDRIGPIRLAGVLLICAGVMMQIAADPAAMAQGHLILGMTGVMWASYVIVVRRRGISALQATAIVAVGSALIYLPVYVLVLPKQIALAPIADILLQMGFQGVLVSVFAVFAFNRSTELLGTIAGATLPALIPLATLLLGMIVLGEYAGTSEAITAIVIGLGVAAILTDRKILTD